MNEYGNIYQNQTPQSGGWSNVIGNVFSKPKVAYQNAATRYSQGGIGAAFKPYSLFGNSYAAESQPSAPQNTTPYGPNPTNSQTDASNWDPNSSSYNAPTASKFQQLYNGKNYSDPTAYSNAIHEAGQTEYNKQMKSLDNAYRSGLISYDEQQQTLKQARGNIKTQMDNLKRDYTLANTNLGTQRDETLGSQSQFFQNSSPDAYQSQQGVYANKVLDNYNQGVSDLNNQRDQNNTSMNQAIQANTNQLAGLSRAKATQEQQYKDQQDAMAAAANQGNDAVQNAMLANGVSNLPEFAPVSANYAALDSSKYMNAFNPMKIGGGASPDKTYQMTLTKIQSSDLTDAEKAQAKSELDYWLTGQSSYANAMG